MWQAAAEEDIKSEMDACSQAVALKRAACHRWSAERYQAEGRCLSVALACGENASALVCCRALVDFLQVNPHSTKADPDPGRIPTQGGSRPRVDPDPPIDGGG